MRTLAYTCYLETRPGAENTLPRGGTALEIPLVYDRAAREVRALSAQGLVTITEERNVPSADGDLIQYVAFRRLR